MCVLLTSLGTLKYDSVVKIREIFNFLPLMNKSVTIEFNFLLLIISAIISSKTINILFSIINIINRKLLLIFCMNDQDIWPIKTVLFFILVCIFIKIYNLYITKSNKVLLTKMLS